MQQQRAKALVDLKKYRRRSTGIKERALGLRMNLTPTSLSGTSYRSPKAQDQNETHKHLTHNAQLLYSEWKFNPYKQNPTNNSSFWSPPSEAKPTARIITTEQEITR